MHTATLPSQDIRLRVVLPPPRITNEEHDAEAASIAGGHRVANGNSATIFTLGLPYPDWHGLVLSVADGKGYAGLGDLASAAVLDAFEDAVRQWADQLELDSGAWQRRVGEAFTAAFDHANARVRSLLGRVDNGPGQGVGLAAAAMLGNWLCVVCAGPGQVFRLTRGTLEQLTSGDPLHRHAPSGDRLAPPLGTAAQVKPSIGFHQLRIGDVILVCSGGLSGTLDTGNVARLMGSLDSAADIARSLVLAGQKTSSQEDMTAVVARVRRVPRRSLPGALRRLASTPADQQALVERFPALMHSAWRSTLLVATLGLLLGGAAGLRQLIVSRAQPDLAPVVLSGRSYLPPTPPTEPTTPPDQPAAAKAAPPRADAAPVREVAVARLEVVTTPTQPRPVSESLAMRQRLSAMERVRDSIMAAESAAAAARQTTKSVVAGSEPPAPVRDSVGVSPGRDALARREHISAGVHALGDWMNALVASVNRAETDSPVLLAGPASFVAFLNRNHPVLSAERLVTTLVDEQQGVASAEWLAQWRTAFGTATSRRMRATASVVPDGNGWTLQRWSLTEGAP